MRRTSGFAIALAFLAAGFASGFLTGRSSGFETGSEWALMQAGIVAREAGVFMPVQLDEGNFRVVIRQRKGLYKRAWQNADEYEERAALKAGKIQVQVAEAGTRAEGGRASF